MNNYINYYKKSLEELEKLPKDKKPTLLLHACCGPCSTFPLTFLCPHFDVTIFFNNSNIYPSEEYFRRLNELKKFLDFFKRDYGYEVKVIETTYDNENYNKDLEKYADQDEGKERCFLCYEKRMDQAFKFANENGYDFFTTVMTISRQKNSQKINEIAGKLREKYDKTRYFFSDFKKNKGIDIAREMRIHYDLYQQLYCGCKFTYEKGLKKRQKNMKNKIAFCGLNCEECEARKATINNDGELRKKVAKLWSEMNQIEIKPEWINCEGCHGNGCKTYFCSEQCEIRKCSLSKGFNTCGECREMEVCEKLKMITDHNESAKNNLKNLK